MEGWIDRQIGQIDQIDQIDWIDEIDQIVQIDYADEKTSIAWKDSVGRLDRLDR